MFNYDASLNTFEACQDETFCRLPRICKKKVTNYNTIIQYKETYYRAIFIIPFAKEKNYFLQDSVFTNF